MVGDIEEDNEQASALLDTITRVLAMLESHTEHEVGIASLEQRRNLPFNQYFWSDWFRTVSLKIEYDSSVLKNERMTSKVVEPSDETMETSSAEQGDAAEDEDKVMADVLTARSRYYIFQLIKLQL